MMKVTVLRTEQLVFFVDTDDEDIARDMIQGTEPESCEDVSEEFTFELGECER